MNNNKGIVVIISGPSGSGKGTIVKEMIKDDKYALSISVTTRSPRVGEEDGVHYFFKSKQEFEEMIHKGELIEWAEFCENYYGTPKSYVEKMLREGKDVILEIEVQGALKVKESNPEAVLIFIVPPSLTELKNRLVGRGTEKEEIIEKRLKRALEELDMIEKYDYLVVNDSIKDAAEKIHTIVEAEHLKANRNLDLIEKIKMEGF
ncbi:MAG: guanylate kinase [Epulopiscium sp.]|jgi:guanylate kinase|uniref:Guanylate kinase n=1 Tax=Defluviitalea raffinosedens TaxID=1450156 RepID=A0A7C8HGG9_9FIRM|nr:guanylate kinase [Defluviitalea raffinosedens]KAE9637210.1 guanylate kinase [Defluviitalea raffinosedens]MBZ4669241.1 guanylate kinase [Defluviitaleaceae bacterium]MDK2788668.1 guanylate kinase [Candidatus Epulonipiscium sp.]HHW66761.1 guanylate kinase [Candidatus Epulonipiscium sp.]